jgi:succinate-semialdehyde dehydrogenase / glutarate-semialdehyde dehydrogenase
MTTQTAAPTRTNFDLELVEALITVPVVAPDAPTHSTVAAFDGMPLFPIPQSSPADVERAFEQARVAQVKWAATDLAERKRIMLRVHDLLLEHQAEGLDLIQWETGKTRIDAFKELAGVCTTARHYARAADGLIGQKRVIGLFPVLTKVLIERRPVGVVGVISPWNYPLYLSIGDAIPALMAGNAVVIKPDQKTSLCALWVVDLIHRAGVPRHVLQVVTGQGTVIGPPLIDRADYVMFTGSSEVGAQIARRCGERLIGCSMELGGKNPMIVLDDADPASAAEIAIRACFDNAGQLCVSMERIYVMEGIREAFLARFLARIHALRMAAEVGWACDFGSLIGATQLERVSAAVDDAVAKGATVLAGGRPLPEVGPYYYAPTVLTDVTEVMRVHAEETFGPVVTIYPVHSEEEAIALANDSVYGLNASVLTGDPKRGVRVGRRINTGTVNINEAYEAAFGSTRAPMGGMGRSGLGRRNGASGLTRFTEEQTIAVQRGIGLGTPFGMEHDEWAGFIGKAFRALKVAGMR